VRDNQFVQIAVAEFAHTKGSADTVLILFVELQDVNVLINVVMDLPSDCEMICTLGGRTDDTVAAVDIWLRKLGLGLV
jgi:hypothetical protein